MPCHCANRNDQVGAALVDGRMAISGVIGAVSANGENGLILRDLRQQVGKGLAITDGVGRHFDRPDIQALGIDRDVNLAPLPANREHVPIRWNHLHRKTMRKNKKTERFWP